MGNFLIGFIFIFFNCSISPARCTKIVEELLTEVETYYLDSSAESALNSKIIKLHLESGETLFRLLDSEDGKNKLEKIASICKKNGKSTRRVELIRGIEKNANLALLRLVVDLRRRLTGNDEEASQYLLQGIYNLAKTESVNDAVFEQFKSGAEFISDAVLDLEKIKYPKTKGILENLQIIKGNIPDSLYDELKKYRALPFLARGISTVDLASAMTFLDAEDSYTVPSKYLSDIAVDLWKHSLPLLSQNTEDKTRFLRVFYNRSTYNQAIALHVLSNSASDAERNVKQAFLVNENEALDLERVKHIGVNALYVAMKGFKNGDALSREKFKEFVSVIPSGFFRIISTLENAGDDENTEDTFLRGMDSLSAEETESILKYLSNDYGRNAIKKLAPQILPSLSQMLQNIASDSYSSILELPNISHYGVLRVMARGQSQFYAIKRVMTLIDKSNHGENFADGVIDTKTLPLGIALSKKRFLRELAPKCIVLESDCGDLRTWISRNPFTLDIGIIILSGSRALELARTRVLGDDVTILNGSSEDDVLDAVKKFQRMSSGGKRDLSAFLREIPCIKASQKFENIHMIGNLMEFGQTISDKSRNGFLKCALNSDQEAGETRSKFVEGLARLEDSIFSRGLAYLENLNKGTRNSLLKNGGSAEFASDSTGHKLAKFLLAFGPVRKNQEDYSTEYLAIYTKMKQSDLHDILKMVRGVLNEEKVSACLKRTVVSGTHLKNDQDCKKLRAFVLENFFGTVALLKSGVSCKDILRVFSDYQMMRIWDDWDGFITKYDMSSRQDNPEGACDKLKRQKEEALLDHFSAQCAEKSVQDSVLEFELDD